MPLLLGLDIGTTSTIGILIDDRGGTVAVESRPVTFHSDHANWAEEDTEEWWRNVGEICRALVAKAGDATPSRPSASPACCRRSSCSIEAGRPLRRSIQQNDARATVELEAYRAAMDESAFLALTGTGYSQQLVGPKLMWLRTPRAGRVLAGGACAGRVRLHHLSPVRQPAGRAQLGARIRLREHRDRSL